MAKSTFAKKLAKDLGRNPKKTAVLALLAAVAVWFWAPLVWKWVAPTSGESLEVVDVVTSTGSSTTAVTAGAGTSAESSTAPARSVNWRSLSDLFQNHQLMATADLAAELHDPFRRAETDEPQDTNEDGEPSTLTAVAALTGTPTPKELGLVVRSTISGGAVRLARINGELCRVGTVLVVRTDNAVVEYEVVDIGPNQVTLSGGGKLYELERQENRTSMQLGRVEDRVVLDGLRRD